MAADDQEAPRAPPAPLAKRLAAAALAAAAGGMILWDAAQLAGPGGEDRRRALGALAAHPIETLRRQRLAAADDRALRALWVQDGRVRAQTHEFLRTLAKAPDEGLDLRAVDLDGLRQTAARADGGDRPALDRLPGLMSDALVAYVAALRRPGPGVKVVFADPALAPMPPAPAAILAAAVRAPSLDGYLQTVRTANPLALGLRQALDACRAAGPCPDAPLLLANLARARALPAQLGRRYILVNVPEQRLWLYEGGRRVDSMPVVVGKLSEPTPELAAMLRYALFNPYWNVPEDLTRTNIAPAVLKQGTGYLRTQGLEVMSDWSEAAHPVDPDSVDWQAAADGGLGLHLRQTPGPRNMMGAVKFMLPNRMGIYLHDTPHREAFGHDVRAESSGCIRLEDAPRLARWLLGPQGARPPSEAPEARVAVPQPTPVYITYLTARAEGPRLVRSPDIYQRDAALVAALAPVAGGLKTVVADRR